MPSRILFRWSYVGMVRIFAMKFSHVLTLFVNRAILVVPPDGLMVKIFSNLFFDI